MAICHLNGGSGSSYGYANSQSNASVWRDQIVILNYVESATPRTLTVACSTQNGVAYTVRAASIHATLVGEIVK